MINKSFLKYLCCPNCKDDLIESNRFLICNKCKEKYETQKGIPILIDLKGLPAHLQQQIEYFEKETVSRAEYKLAAWQKSYIKRLEENINFRKNEVLIDMGTGSGYIAIEMARRGLRIIACDLTLKSLISLKDLAYKEHLEDNLSLVCCTVESLPIINHAADYLVSNAVLEHLPKEKEAIEEINRVCKRKASLMITVPLEYKYLNPLFIPLNYIHDKRIGHLRRYNLEILREKFRKWKIINIYYPGHFLKVIKTIINIFIKLFDEDKIESEDRKSSSRKWWASNICVVFERKK